MYILLRQTSSAASSVVCVAARPINLLRKEGEREEERGGDTGLRYMGMGAMDAYVGALLLLENRYRLRRGEYMAEGMILDCDNPEL